MTLAKNLIAAAGNAAAGRGEAIFTTTGSNSWVVPAGVTSISAVCIGGGGGGDASASGGSGGRGGDLRYYNNLSVTPGETLTITVGAGGTAGATPTAGGFSRIARSATTLLEAGGGAEGSTGGSGNTTNGTSSTIAGSIGGGNGGTGANPGIDTTSGGGGAGGYSGAGGNGNTGDGGNGSGGGGGGGGGGGQDDLGGPGGGVNVFGSGPNGVGGTGTASNGDCATGGSYGDGGLNNSTSGIGGEFLVNNFGAGGGGADNITESSVGGRGVVRIVWPGNSRSFPSTDVWMSEVITTVIETQSLTSGSITIPSSALAGDLAVLCNAHGTVAAQSNPSGWIRIVNQEASTPVLTVWYRIIQSGDAGASVTMTGGSSPSSEIILFRKATGTVSSVTVSGGTIQQSASIPTTQTQTISSATPPFIAFGVAATSITSVGSSDMTFTGGVAGTGNVEPSGVFTGTNGDSSREAFMRFRIYDAAPATNLSVVFRRDVGAQTMASFIIEVN